MAESIFPDGNNAQPYSSMVGKLQPELLRGLKAMEFEYMTPVQSKVLAELPSFRSDCLVQAKTGTGKTTTRATNLDKFMKGSPSILVATPGRLNDYLSEPPVVAKFAKMRTLILDEADTMLDSGFLDTIMQALRQLPPKSNGWQGMCFSATIPEKIKTVIECVLDPGYASITTIDKTEPPTLERVPQFHILIPSVTDTFNVLYSLLTVEANSNSKIVIFGVTANMVALFSNLFSHGLAFLQIYELHSRLSQNIRTKTTDNFKAATSGLMFASDVVGRGMDFPNVDVVIQIGLPANGEQYIHRVGRTARAGNDGRAVIILTERESFFLKRNSNLPIKPHPNTQKILNGAAGYASYIETAMYAVPEAVKQKAYSSFIGFFAGSGFLKPLRMDKEDLVQMANEFAIKGMFFPEPPPMEKKTVAKMGLRGVPGFNYDTGVENGGSGSGRGRGAQVSRTQESGGVKKGGGGRGGRGKGRGRGGDGGGGTGGRNTRSQVGNTKQEGGD
ncbi:MAG: hypothetical protein MMC33_010761, partial [Icmadophila ericetorum]|nr:hypothetical protein [Icmadophila ericetorum]